ncbi:hypothetical protein GcM1_243143 [Golovinomyces cichoracearum]|uniref:Transcription factor Iwr1 domain-containing protein n=1 Tax=Golovinomyces cichoracearum TaxID=62708 RepID=A0A420IGN5_9PEZI|nr:hypothetical protein GcM1_243143 [Golovinomyces cichoracearum]
MFLPPEEIKIKRKRTDEPVELLHIQESRSKKMKFTSDFVFCRQSTSQIANTNQATPPSSSLSLEYSERKLAESLKIKNTKIPRHFHLCRSEITSESSLSINHYNRKRKADTVFVERKSRLVHKSKIRDEQNLSAVTQPTPDPIKNNTLQKNKTLDIVACCPTPATDFPGLLSLNNESFSSNNKTTWDVTSQDLIAKMQAYTLSEIAKNIAASEAERPPNKPNSHETTASIQLTSSQPTRFKPKAPAQRYKDRQRNKLDLDTETDLENEYFEEAGGNDEDWVVETYLRMPLENAEAEKCSNFGFLVLESEAEIEEFYHIDTDSEEDYEDEDENAENHYSADYPDEEVASDDEFDRNAYYYSKDIDEFEYDAFSDDEQDVKQSSPWYSSSPWRRKWDDLINDEDEESD